jgi:hypothetical protein
MTTPSQRRDSRRRLRLSGFGLGDGASSNPGRLGLVAAEPTAEGHVHVAHRLTIDPAEG